MSCHLQPYLLLNDVVGLKEYLFPGLKETVIPNQKNNEENEEKDEEGWDEDWGEDWNEQDNEPEEEVTKGSELDEEAINNASQKWLQDCVYAVSPSADLIALANQNRMVLMSHSSNMKASADDNVGMDTNEFTSSDKVENMVEKGEIALTTKYGGDRDSQEEDDLLRYSAVWSGSVSQQDSEFVTALLCLPLASQKRSTQGAPDWTCVLVGFSSGYVRMFTETGTLLLSQKLHTEAVQKLKCNTYTTPRYLGVAEQHEELLIMYLRALVTVDGFSLFQSLKACRNQVARATASGETSLQPPPLAYKKWAPQDMDYIVDCHTTGISTPNPFDQMALASIENFNSSIRPTPPAASMYILTGLGPYLGFFYAIEGSAQPILSEVAYAVASKLKSAIMSAASGWLGFGSKGRTENSAEKPPKIEPATPLPLRFSLPDQRREGLSVCLSPNNTYAVTTDSYGRVMLIDVERGIAVRIWKGYRDAQIGWVEVREDEGPHSSHTRQSRIAQFLVIYAARRGILEVWMVGNGPRVAAFNVSKFCRLVHVSHGIMGLNNVTCKGVKIKAFQVGLMDPNGTLKTVEVPFHLALSDKNNKRVRDMHLLKKLKQVLKENWEETESLSNQVQDLLQNIKIPSITQQGVERVLSTKYLSPGFMEKILKMCIQRLRSGGEDSVHIERRLFGNYCHSQQKLIQLYVDIDHLQGDNSPTHTDSQTLSRLLGLSEADVDHITCEVDRSHKLRHKSKGHARVHFDSDSVSHVSSFLSCFSCNTHASDTDSSQQNAHTITLVRDLKEDRRLQLGNFFFDRCFKHQCSSSDLGAMLRKSGLPLEDLGKLLLFTWLNDPGRTIDSVPPLVNLLKVISTSLDKSRVAVDSHSESPWWQSLRNLCSHSSNVQSGFLAAVVCRSVTMEITGAGTRVKGIDTSESAKDPDADTISVTSEVSPMLETETIPSDVEAWNLLTKQLEDLMVVDSFVKLRPCDPKRAPYAEEISVTVAGLLEGGKGCISEVIARHVSRVGFQPEDLYKPIQEESAGQEVMETTPDSTTLQASKQQIIWDQMTLLRKRFPHSLENDVLFSNSCWEYTVLWNKQPEDIDNLKWALEFLKLVQNAMLRQGVSSMMWHMFMLKRFQACANLMEKVGKVPKDRLCRKEIGVSETHLPLFLSCICDFLSIIMEANCETNEVPVFNLEHTWNKVKGTISLVELAIDQKGTNYGLLKHHNHLALLMSAILTFNIKSVKVLSLFDSKGKNAFFQELHSHPLLPTTNIETTISVARKQFLTRVISQSVMKLQELSPASTSEPTSQASVISRLKSSDEGQWPDIVMRLSDEFGLDVDFLKRHHVCELYSAGFDRLAEQVLLTVNDHQSLGTQMLTIVGQRVAHRLAKLESNTVVELMSNVNPSLSTWLKSMNSKLLLHPEVAVTDLQSLVTQTLNHLSDEQTDHELAMSLVELVQVL